MEETKVPEFEKIKVLVSIIKIVHKFDPTAPL